MKPEMLPVPETKAVSLYAIFTGISKAFMMADRSDYNMEAHAKFVRVRKHAYEASYWLEAGTRDDKHNAR